MMQFLDDVHIFSDSDGVVYDFEGGFKQQFGLKWADTPPSKAWPLIYRTPDFYYNLPLFPWAREYWAAIALHRPTVLSGAPTAGFAAAADAKRRAWARDFGEDVPVIVCVSRDKPLHLRKPGDILIDDKQKMLDNWISFGGTGILFESVEQTISDLKAMMETHAEQVDVDLMVDNILALKT